MIEKNKHGQIEDLEIARTLAYQEKTDRDQAAELKVLAGGMKGLKNIGKRRRALKEASDYDTLASQEGDRTEEILNVNVPVILREMVQQVNELKSNHKWAWASKGIIEFEKDEKAGQEVIKIHKGNYLEPGMFSVDTLVFQGDGLEPVANSTFTVEPSPMRGFPLKQQLGSSPEVLGGSSETTRSVKSIPNPSELYVKTQVFEAHERLQRLVEEAQIEASKAA
jgi:hypothetical protein